MVPNFEAGENLSIMHDNITVSTLPYGREKFKLKGAILTDILDFHKWLCVF